MDKAKVYYFNPTCELAIANGSFSYMPPLLLQEMEKDLSVLPFVFASANDIILTENKPSSEFMNTLKMAGFNLPKFYTFKELNAIPSGSIDSIVPWGWSPSSHFILKELKEKCSDEFKKSPVFDWKAEHQLLYERSTSLDLLHKILKNNCFGWLIDENRCGKMVENCSEIETMLKKHPEIVLKAPLSSSGRGIQIIRNGKLNASNLKWISGVLKQQKYLIAEPFLNKVIDLSFQFEILDHCEVAYLGYSVFETNSNGQYKGTFIRPDLKTLLPDDDTTVVRQMIETTSGILQEALKISDYTQYYRGYLGIDSLIFRQNGQLKIQPCIEINCRMTMGLLGLQLEKVIHRDAKGKFELFYAKSDEFMNKVKQQSQENEPKFREGKIISGFLSLAEPEPNGKFGAYIFLGSAK